MKEKTGRSRFKRFLSVGFDLMVVALFLHWLLMTDGSGWERYAYLAMISSVALGRASRFLRSGDSRKVMDVSGVTVCFLVLIGLFVVPQHIALTVILSAIVTAVSILVAVTHPYAFPSKKPE